MKFAVGKTPTLPVDLIHQKTVPGKILRVSLFLLSNSVIFSLLSSLIFSLFLLTVFLIPSLFYLTNRLNIKSFVQVQSYKIKQHKYNLEPTAFECQPAKQNEQIHGLNLLCKRINCISDKSLFLSGRIRLPCAYRRTEVPPPARKPVRRTLKLISSGIIAVLNIIYLKVSRTF